MAETKLTSKCQKCRFYLNFRHDDPKHTRVRILGEGGGGGGAGSDAMLNIVRESYQVLNGVRIRHNTGAPETGIFKKMCQTRHIFVYFHSFRMTNIAQIL